MPLFLQYLYVIGIFQGALLSGLLLFGGKNTTANCLLGIWCLLLSLYFVGPFITMGQEINAFSSLIGWSHFLPSSFGALLYLYCRSAIVDQKVVPADSWVLLPFIVCLLLNLDILMAAPEVKLSIILAGAPNTTTFIASEIIQALQAFAFIALSYQLINKYKLEAEDTLSSFNPAIFKWLLKLVILFFSIWSLKLIGGVIDDHAYLSILADVLIVFMIYSIAMAQWRNPKLFTIEQLSNDQNHLHSGINKSDLSADAEEKQHQREKNSTLDDNIRDSLLKALTEHMEKEQTFLDSQLTLTRLSDAIGLTTHHLSEVLNQQNGQNFYQFVNEYRVNYFCLRLAQNHNIKLLDLALEAGFSSKSTFNSVFKQIKGLTPSQYRKTLN